MNYTKGNWEVKENGQHETPSIQSGFEEICRMKDTLNHTLKGNASLISQAPAMYEQLLKMKTWLTGLAEHDEQKAKSERFATLRDAYIHDAKNYRAVIADIDKAVAGVDKR